MKVFLLWMKGEVMGQEYDVKTSQKDKTPQICLNSQQEYLMKDRIILHSLSVK